MNHRRSPGHTLEENSAPPAHQIRGCRNGTAERITSPLVALLICAGLISSFGSMATAAPPEIPGRTVEFVKGRILVQPRAGLSDHQLDLLLKPHGARRAAHLQSINVHVIELPSEANEMALVTALQKNPHIKFAELDEVVRPEMLVNDPYVSKAWHISTTRAPNAWDISTGLNVPVAILDTGVDGTHPDLAANLMSGWNIYDNNSNTADVKGHGTSTAGVAGSIGNNSVGVVGTAWRSKIMPVRISDSTGGSTFSLIANGVTWAADRGAKVVSISYKNLARSSAVTSAAQYIRGKGGVVVVAGGNDGVYDSTAANNSMTVVSATDSADNRTSWSNYGPYIDVAAPGAYVWTTTKGGGYAQGIGTSFSTPLVAGVYAMMMAANPTLPPSTLDSILFSTALDRGTTGYDQYYGHGRVDAYAAVNKAKSTVASDTTAPATSIKSPTSGGKVTGVATVDAAASDTSGIAKVELYAGGKLVGTDTASPFAFSWDSSQWADGDVALQSKAYDVAGNVGTSASVTVTVANDTQPPVVKISNPVSGSKVSGTVAISVSATDDKKVSQISLLIDGKQVALSYGSSLSYSWAVPRTKGSNGGSGTSTITARAYDAAKNTSSASVTVYR